MKFREMGFKVGIYMSCPMEGSHPIGTETAVSATKVSSLDNDSSPFLLDYQFIIYPT